MREIESQYEFKHMMNYTMVVVFKHYLNGREWIELEDMQVGSEGDGDYSLTMFNVSDSQARRLQTLQNDMLGGL